MYNQLLGVMLTVDWFKQTNILSKYPNHCHGSIYILPSLSLFLPSSLSLSLALSFSLYVCSSLLSGFLFFHSFLTSSLLSSSSYHTYKPNQTYWQSITITTFCSTEWREEEKKMILCVRRRVWVCRCMEVHVFTMPHAPSFWKVSYIEPIQKMRHMNGTEQMKW